MDAYRKVCPVKLPNDEDRKDALGSLAGEKFRLKKALQAILPYFQPIPNQEPGDWMYENEVDGQPYNIYTTIPINQFHQERNKIFIVSLDCSILKEEMKIIKKSAKSFFPGSIIKILIPQTFKKEDMGEYYSEFYKKNMYSAQKILKFLETLVTKTTYCLLALTDHFIYNLPSEKSLFEFPLKYEYNKESTKPDEWWVFGLASIKDRTGVVSYKRFFENIPDIVPRRLLNEDNNCKRQIKTDNNLSSGDQIISNKQQNSQPQTQKQKEEEKKLEIKQQFIEPISLTKQQILYNLVKVVNHELTHMFGIRHCIYYKCLMNGSSYSAQRFRDAIAKEFELCPICLRKLQFNMGFDVLSRYNELKEFCQQQDAEFSRALEKYKVLYQAVQTSLTINSKSQSKK